MTANDSFFQKQRPAAVVKRSREARFTTESVAAVAVLGVIGTGIAYVLNYQIISTGTPEPPGCPGQLFSPWQDRFTTGIPPTSSGSSGSYPFYRPVTTWSAGPRADPLPFRNIRAVVLLPLWYVTIRIRCLLFVFSGQRADLC